MCAAKVFVGNLSWHTREDNLRTAFGKFGNIEDCVVLTDRETGKSRGFGFVTFDSEGNANSAIEEMNSSELDGRSIKVAIASDRPSYPRNSSGGDREYQSRDGGGYRSGGYGRDRDNDSGGYSRGREGDGGYGRDRDSYEGGGGSYQRQDRYGGERAPRRSYNDREY